MYSIPSNIIWMIMIKHGTVRINHLWCTTSVVLGQALLNYRIFFAFEELTNACTIQILAYNVS